MSLLIGSEKLIHQTLRSVYKKGRISSHKKKKEKNSRLLTGSEKLLGQTLRKV